MKRLWTVLAILGLAGLGSPLDAKDPARWEKDIREIEARAQAACPAPGGVVFVGSSSIRLWDLAKSFPTLKAVNAGFGGSQIPDSLRYAGRVVLPWKPATVVMYAGENDLQAGHTPEQLAAHFIEFAATIHAALPECRVVFLSVKLSESRRKLWPQARTANELIRHFCLALGPEQFQFIDLTTPLLGPDGTPEAKYFRDDKLHLTEAGYAVWNRVLQQTLFKP